MILKRYAILVLCYALTGCVTALPNSTPTHVPATGVPVSPTQGITMLPTWTPANTPTPMATRRPTFTPTPTEDSGSLPRIPGTSSTELLIDRPTNAQEAKPANLVSMQYDTGRWSLYTSYPTDFMGYSLIHRSIYGCALEPVVDQEIQGYEVEKYSRTLGTTTYEIARYSQAGILSFANYCTGEGDDHTCYKLTPGEDHEACTQAGEQALSTFKLNVNPFYGSTAKPTNRWACQDAAGTVGLCLISYSIPLNALAFSPDGQAWAAGDDGVLLHREGQAWKEVINPAIHPLYDLYFSGATNGWAVGDGAEVLHWDGNQWTEALPYHGPGEGPGGSTQVLYAVDAFAANDAWMVGVVKGIDGKHRPYAIHWNGKDLLEESNFPDCNCGLNAVLIRSRNDIYAAGGSDLGAIIFHWDGTSWSSTLLTGADHLYSLSQTSDGTLWAGGIEVARDQTDTRGALFHWDGNQWLRVAVPPLTGGIYALKALNTGQIVLGGDFTALRAGLEWQAISTDIMGYQWIVDIEQEPQGYVWALTRSGNLFQFGMNR